MVRSNLMNVGGHGLQTAQCYILKGIGYSLIPFVKPSNQIMVSGEFYNKIMGTKLFFFLFKTVVLFCY